MDRHYQAVQLAYEEHAQPFGVTVQDGVEATRPSPSDPRARPMPRAGQHTTLEGTTVNLRSGNSIEAGVSVTRALAPVPAAAPAPRTEPSDSAASPFVPGRPITLADVIGIGPETAPTRLDPAFFADTNTLRAAIAHWSREQLYTIGNVFLEEGDRRDERKLVEVLRWLCERGSNAPDPPIAKVEFVTNSDYEDGLFWDDEPFYLHRTDGTVERYDWPEGYDKDPEWQQVDERYDELLAAYSRAHRPMAHGAHLFLDLTTGQFDQDSEWSLLP